MLIRRIVKIPSKTDKDFYGACGAASDPAIITLMVMMVLMVILIMVMVMVVVMIMMVLMMIYRFCRTHIMLRDVWPF